MKSLCVWRSNRSDANLYFSRFTQHLRIEMRGTDSDTAAVVDVPARKKAHRSRRGGAKRQTAEWRKMKSERRDVSKTDGKREDSCTSGGDVIFAKSAENVPAGTGRVEVVRETVADRGTSQEERLYSSDVAGDRRVGAESDVGNPVATGRASEEAAGKKKKAHRSKRGGVRRQTAEQRKRRAERLLEESTNREVSTTRRDDVVAENEGVVTSLDGLPLARLTDDLSPAAVVPQENAAVVATDRLRDGCGFATAETAAVAAVRAGNAVRETTFFCGRFDDETPLTIGYSVETSDLHGVRVVVYRHGRVPDGTVLQLRASLYLTAVLELGSVAGPTDSSGHSFLTFEAARVAVNRSRSAGVRETSLECEIGKEMPTGISFPFLVSSGTGDDVVPGGERSRATEIRARPRSSVPSGPDADVLWRVDRPRRRKVGFFRRWGRRIASALLCCCGQLKSDA